jgi:tetratricopeptide (TPR) repeat protein
LPDQLKSVWNDPEALYDAIVMAMQDGFFDEVIEAAKHLVEIDKITDRSYNVLGLAYMHTNALAEAEQTLNKGISVSDYKAVMTTNLAKVYVSQGQEQKAMQTLWSAIELDPNQDNGLDWFTVLEFEKGGEPARIASYKKVAALPNSWRAKLYIARHHLEQKQFEIAKEIYKDILSIASNEPDAIWVITGDLGLNNRIDDIFELVSPIFSVDKHGINGAINMIQACIATKRKKEGLRLLDDFKKLQRYDLLHITNDFENKLNKL